MQRSPSETSPLNSRTRIQYQSFGSSDEDPNDGFDIITPEDAQEALTTSKPSQPSAPREEPVGLKKSSPLDLEDDPPIDEFITEEEMNEEEKEEHADNEYGFVGSDSKEADVEFKKDNEGLLTQVTDDSSFLLVAHESKEGRELKPDAFAAKHFPEKNEDYSIHFHIRGVRINFNSRELAKTVGLYVFSTFCNAPGIMYALGAITSTPPIDIPSQFSCWSMAAKVGSIIIASFYSYVHIPLIAENILPAIYSWGYFGNTFRKHPFRGGGIIFLAINGAGAHSIMGFRSLAKVNMWLAVLCALANFGSNVVSRPLSLNKAAQAYDEGHLGLTVPAVVLGLSALFPFGAKLAEAYEFLGADVTKLSDWGAAIVFPLASAANFITYVYQSSHFIPTLREGKQALQPEQEMPIDSTLFVIRSIFSKNKTTTYSQSTYKKVEAAVNLVALPAASFSNFNLARDGFEPKDSIWRPFIKPNTIPAKVIQALYAVSAFTTYSKLSIERNFKCNKERALVAGAEPNPENHLRTLPEEPMSEQSQLLSPSRR